MTTASTKDDDSVGSSGSSESFGRVFAREVPKYDKHRMLMPSPVPSPKMIKKPLQLTKIGHDDDESTDDCERANEREKEKISRLVKMAKAQQNLMTAWFAASSGVAELPPMVPSRRKSSSSSSQKRRSTPVDLDTDDEWSQTSDAKSVSSSGLKSRSDASSLSSANSRFGFLSSIMPNSSNKSFSGSVSVFSGLSGETPKMSNVSPNKQFDPELGSIDEENNEYNWHSSPLCTRNRWILASLLIMFLIAIIAFGISVVISKEKPRKIKTNQLETFAPAPVLPVLPIFKREPSALPSASPSERPSTNKPSTSPSTRTPSSAPTLTSAPSTSLPSGAPTQPPSSFPTFAPSVSPTVFPTLLPTFSPSDRPSIPPSVSPTISQFPSPAPSNRPSTIFSTTNLVLHGSEIAGVQAQEQFGYVTALSGNGEILAIGSRYYNNDGLRRAGRVEAYIFDFASQEWVARGQPLYGRNEQDQFGFSVSLSDDGNRMAISEPGLDGESGDRAGGVRVFDWKTFSAAHIWVPVGQGLQGEGRAALFGVSIKLSGNGNRLAVGSPYFSNLLNLSGRVRVFEIRSTPNVADVQMWNHLGDALDGSFSSDWFGWSLDLNHDGFHLVVGAPRNAEYGGYVRYYKFSVSGSNYGWNQVGSDIINQDENSEPDDRFGMSISLLSGDGRNKLIAIGSPWANAGNDSLPNNGLAVVYQRHNDSDWTRIGQPIVGTTPNEQCGQSIKLASAEDDGLILAVGSPGYEGGKGRILYHSLTDTGNWDATNSHPTGDSSQEGLGFSLDMNANASLVAIGGPASSSPFPSAGSVKVFRRVEGSAT